MSSVFLASSQTTTLKIGGRLSCTVLSLCHCRKKGVDKEECLGSGTRDKDLSPHSFWEVTPGSPSAGVGKWDREGKEAHAGCIYELVTMSVTEVQSHWWPRGTVKHDPESSQSKGKKAGVSITRSRNILLRFIFCICAYEKHWSVIFLSCDIFILLLYQGNTCIIKWIKKFSLLVYFQKEFA